ncbi:hypothetical protein GGF32_007428 [Allomyces javanicus]|nr:hypothetical protein GGF32_007428 [Allomyces javanicus]
MAPFYSSSRIDLVSGDIYGSCLLIWVVQTLVPVATAAFIWAIYRIQYRHQSSTAYAPIAVDPLIDADSDYAAELAGSEIAPGAGSYAPVAVLEIVRDVNAARAKLFTRRALVAVTAGYTVSLVLGAVLAVPVTHAVAWQAVHATFAVVLAVTVMRVPSTRIGAVAAVAAVDAVCMHVSLRAAVLDDHAVVAAVQAVLAVTAFALAIVEYNRATRIAQKAILASSTVADGALAPSLEPVATVWQHLTYSWFTPLVHAGFQRPLELTDLWDLVLDDKSSSAIRKYMHHARPGRLAIVAAMTSLRVPMITQILMSILYALMNFAGPFFPNRLLAFLERGDRQGGEWVPWMLVGGMFLGASATSFFQGLMFFLGRRVGARLRAVLTSLLFRKTLTRNQYAARAGDDDGYKGKKKQDIYDALLAAQGIIDQAVLGSNHTVALSIKDSAGNLTVAIKEVFDAAHDGAVAIIGEVGSSVTIPLALATTNLGLWTCSGSATAPDLAATKGFPMSAGTAGLALSWAMTIGDVCRLNVQLYALAEMGMNSVERVLEYTQIEQEAQGGAAPAVTQWPTHGAMTASDLVLQYPSSTTPVPHGVSFALNPREKWGVVGRTGAGKSSLALVLLRMMEPLSGTVEIDGVRASDLDLKVLRSRVTMVPQDVVLFEGTVRSNLDVLGEFDDAACWSALARVHFFESTVQAVDTVDAAAAADDHGSLATTPTTTWTLDSKIGAGGKNLSVGQRQLLVLARALVRRSKVIIFDESTANIQHTIREKFADSTVLCIAHRLRTIADFDKVLVMDHGRVVEFGAPADLLRNPEGVFFHMCRESGEFERFAALAAARSTCGTVEDAVLQAGV